MENEQHYPKTADGVIIYPGMTLYRSSGDSILCASALWVGRHTVVIDGQFKECWFSGYCYSKPSLALASIGK